MLAIKLSRVGKKKQPSYRVIVTEKSRDPWGKHNEIIGFYNPLANPKVIDFKAERVKYWISKGAQPTDTVHNLLVNAGIIEGEKRKAHPTHKMSAEELAKIEEAKKAEAEAAKAKEEAANTEAEAPAEKANAEEAAPAEEAPKEEAPAEEPKQEEEKKEEKPAEEPKAEEAPKEEAPAEEKKEDEKPAE